LAIRHSGAGRFEIVTFFWNSILFVGEVTGSIAIGQTLADTDL